MPSRAFRTMGGPARARTSTTAFIPPKMLGTYSAAPGSNFHSPSTTRRYSCLLNGSRSSLNHRPSPTDLSGVAVGFQPLKSPATQTCLAVGWKNSKRTRRLSGRCPAMLGWVFALISISSVGTDTSGRASGFRFSAQADFARNELPDFAPETDFHRLAGFQRAQANAAPPL